MFSDYPVRALWHTHGQQQRPRPIGIVVGMRFAGLASASAVSSSYAMAPMTRGHCHRIVELLVFDFIVPGQFDGDFRDDSDDADCRERVLLCTDVRTRFGTPLRCTLIDDVNEARAVRRASAVRPTRVLLAAIMCALPASARMPRVRRHRVLNACHVDYGDMLGATVSLVANEQCSS